MSDVNLNLNRKWRSKNFDQIVGQELSIRMLKNSLYLGHYFPVYLFSGQRGCGKTSTARVFATAINCLQLDTFKKNPKKSIVPCLACESCMAMLQMRHPDFIEIDAASHTGVDNVRQIIDSASLLPLMGRKKIYLIDEAHMLSKAAFNAFLKILEEPPSSVLFILATTDPEKIIDTVKSRCFQLFFKSVDAKKLLHHLMHICKQEEIAYEVQALELIIKETDGSARDAINVLEQVRFAHAKISKMAVQQVLGHIDDYRIIQLFSHILYDSPEKMLTYLATIQADFCSPEFLWQKLIHLTRACLWLTHGVPLKDFSEYKKELLAIIKNTSWAQLTQLLNIFYKNEQIFLKTTDKYPFLEMILLQICQKNHSTNSSSSAAAAVAQPVEVLDRQHYEDEEDDEEEDEWDDDEQEEEIEETDFKRWKQFIGDIEKIEDPLLQSVFSQGAFVEKKEEKICVEFSKNFIFFQEWLEKTTSCWMPLLQKRFGNECSFLPQFTGKAEEVQKIKKITNKATIPSKKIESKPVYQKRKKASLYKPTQNTVVDVSDVNLWKKAHLLLRYFPGTIVESKMK